ncbi:MAG: cyclase family protein [Terrimesophilobacter sp.]
MDTISDFAPLLGAQLLNRPFKIVDLTRPIFEGMPQWYGHQRTFIMTNQTHAQFEKTYKTSCGFEAHNLLISEHCGTHTDAIFEYDPEGPRLDESPLELYYGPAICLDVSKGIGDTDQLSQAQLEEALAQSGLDIRQGDAVLLHFGYGDRVWPELEYAEANPGLSTEAAEWLAKQGVVNIGVDHMAIDSSTDTEFSGHVVCKKYGIVNTESLTNLDQVISQRFLFFGLPLNIREGTGSPIRAIAVLVDPDRLTSSES